MEEKKNKQSDKDRLRLKFYDQIPIAFFGYGLIGLTIFLFFPNLLKLTDSTNNLLIGLCAGMAIVGLFSIMSRYLRTPSTYDSEKQKSDSEFEFKILMERFESRMYDFQEKFGIELRMLMERMNEQKVKANDIQFTEKQTKEIFDKISSSVTENLTKDFYDRLEKNIKTEIIGERQEKSFSIAKNYDAAITRLKREIDLLTKRANLNLMIGSVITVSALFLLGYFVIRENFNADNILQVSLHFIPRLSLVVFIELFSFFFLKLYRTSLGEIKYYQNELTNVELKQIGLIAATNYGKEDDISNIIKELSSVERNFKLQKGESTVELEKTKVETQSLKEILKASITAIGKNK